VLADLREEIEVELENLQELAKVAQPLVEAPAQGRTPTQIEIIAMPGILHSLLADYLRFRHRFRNTYSFQLDWGKMTPLVLNFPLVYKRVVQELTQFLPEIEGEGISSI